MVAQHVVDIEAGVRQHIQVRNVAGCQLQVGIDFRPGDDQGVLQAELGQLDPQGCGLRRGQRCTVQDHQRTVLGLGGQGVTQGQRADLLGEVDLVAAVHRTVRLGTADELGRFARAVTGATGALLLVHLLPGPGDFVAGLDLVRAGAALGQLPDHATLQDVRADLLDPEDGVRQLDLASLGRVEGDYVELHASPPSCWVSS